MHSVVAESPICDPEPARLERCAVCHESKRKDQFDGLGPHEFCLKIDIAPANLRELRLIGRRKALDRVADPAIDEPQTIIKRDTSGL